MLARIHAAPAFAPARIQEKGLGELLMHWFCARVLCFSTGLEVLVEDLFRGFIESI